MKYKKYAPIFFVVVAIFIILGIGFFLTPNGRRLSENSNNVSQLAKPPTKPPVKEIPDTAVSENDGGLYYLALPKNTSVGSVESCYTSTYIDRYGVPDFTKHDIRARLLQQKKVILAKKYYLELSAFNFFTLIQAMEFSLTEWVNSRDNIFPLVTVVSFPGEIKIDIEGVRSMATQCLSGPFVFGGKHAEIVGKYAANFDSAKGYGFCSESQKKRMKDLEQRLNDGIGTAEGVALYVSGYHKNFIPLTGEGLKYLQEENKSLYKEITSCALSLSFSISPVDKCSQSQKGDGYKTMRISTGTGYSDSCVLVDAADGAGGTYLSNQGDNILKFADDMKKLSEKYEAELKAIELQLSNL